MKRSKDWRNVTKGTPRPSRPVHMSQTEKQRMLPGPDLGIGLGHKPSQRFPGQMLEEKKSDLQKPS